MITAVDMHVLSGKYQGSRSFLEGLYTALPQIDHDHQFVLAVDKDCPPDLPLCQQFPSIQYPVKNRLNRLLWGASVVARKSKADFFHSTYISPWNLPCPSILSVHDILFDSYPEYFTPSFVRNFQWLVGSSVRRATKIITGSAFSRDALIKKYNLQENQIHLVPCAVDPSIFHPGDKHQARGLIKEKYGVEDYILTVGRLEPRKNHAGLLDALENLLTRTGHCPPLVIVGQPDFNYQSILDKVKSYPGRVHVFSEVDSLDLAMFYRAATLFAYCSKAEGFGIPPLEAMSCGCPVITSNRTSIPEVVGSAGLLINPDNTREITESIETLINDEGLQKKLMAEGLVQAETFSWRKSAALFVELLETLEQETLARKK